MMNKQVTIVTSVLIVLDVTGMTTGAVSVQFGSGMIASLGTVAICNIFGVFGRNK